MDTPQVFIKKNQAVLNWVLPSSDVGSTLVYRAEDILNDNVGSRTLIGSTARTTITYTDSTSGSRYNIYRLQFTNDTGSSPLSDPISPQCSELLADIDEVKRIARISANSDLGSDEIYDAIKDATNWVYREYGDPIKKTAIYLDNDDSDESYTYSFVGDKNPVYQIRNVTAYDSVEEESVSGSSWIACYRDGLIAFTNSFVTTWSNETVKIEWVPQIFNDLVKTKAALDLIETGMVVDGADVINSRVTKLTRQLEEIRNCIKPKGIWAPRHVMDSQFIDTDPSHVSDWADYIGQKFDRKSLRFNDDTFTF